MRRRSSRAGVAGLEFALVAPILVTLMIASIDFGAALLSKAQISQALALAAEYATLAGQNTTTSAPTNATIMANAKTYAGSLASAFVGTPTVTAVLNNGAAAGSTCCPGTVWTCSTATTCADGSSPGTYLKISVTYPFKPLFTADARLVGKILSDSIVVPVK
jgi:Flp pilus assembly protein TadG